MHFYVYIIEDTTMNHDNNNNFNFSKRTIANCPFQRPRSIHKFLWKIPVFQAHIRNIISGP